MVLALVAAAAAAVSLLPGRGVAGVSVVLPLGPHPRLRLNESGLARVREATGVMAGDPLARGLLANLTVRVDTILGQPVETGEYLLNCLGDRMYPLGLLFRLSGNASRRAELAERAAAEMLAVARLDNWNPRRFLTVAETMQAVSIGYDWFYGALTAAQRVEIEDGLVRNGLSVGMACYHDNCTWTPGIAGVGNCSGCWWIRARFMNWNVVSNGGMAIAALALADVPRFASLATQALAFSAAGIPHAIAGYGPTSSDGAWPEGPGYWVYTTKWLLAVTECLTTATGSDNGYMDTPGISNTATYALNAYHTPSDTTFNYGDAEEGPADIEVASLLLGLTARFPRHYNVPAAVAAARHAIGYTTPANMREDGGWDVAALSLMQWPRDPPNSTVPGSSSRSAIAPASDRTDDSTVGFETMPTAAFFLGQAVGMVRSGWGKESSLVAIKGGDSTITHQDLDHGTFVWDTRGYRWVHDLGMESYSLTNMFLPFGTPGDLSSPRRYEYYRKSTRGHNTLAFRDPGGFGPADAEASDQAVNIFSPLTQGSSCHGSGSTARCGEGHLLTVNLTEAYAPRLPNGLPDTASPASARVSVQRAMHTNANMSQLLVIDSIGGNNRDNVTWGIHTRAAVAARASGGVDDRSVVVLSAPNGMKLQMSVESKPPQACGPWRWATVQLPGGTMLNNTRFPLRGAKKVWLVCSSQVSELRVTMSDL